MPCGHKLRMEASETHFALLYPQTFISKQGIDNSHQQIGHCENHSFSLELETAIATSLQESSSRLTNQIVRNPSGLSVFHSEFDNFDQLINDISGKGSVHTAHGIMLQEISEDSEQSFHELPRVERLKNRSWTEPDESQLEDVYVSQRRSPILQVSRSYVPGSVISHQASQKQDTAWLLLRSVCSADQTIPGWAGFVSELGDPPKRRTAIDYYPVIFEPITQYSTVKECLKYAEEATDEVGQYYVYSTDEGLSAALEFS